MKAKAEDVVRRYRSSPDQFQLTLLCGPNVTMCQSLTDELVAPMAGSAERVDLSIADVGNAPARLTEEASSASLFGDKRYIVLRLNSGEATRAAAAIENLLANDNRGDPVFVIAPGMAEKTALGKLITSAANGLIATCYETTPEQAAAAIRSMAGDQGVLLSKEMIQEIAAITNNDLVLARMEVEKIALYLDATKEEPKQPDANILSLLGAQNDEEDISLLINAALNGEAKILADEIAASRSIGLSEIGLIRIMLSHLTRLAAMRTKVDQGNNIDRIVSHPSVFYKDQKNFARQLRIWSSAAISRLIERLVEMEIKLKSSGQPEHVLLEELLLQIARHAAKIR